MAGNEAGALSGLKVVEIAQGWAGPLASVLLADFGADVVKVESIQRLDWWRGAAAGADDGFTHERSWFYNGINRNKSGITLDLTQPRGRELLLDLVRGADVFIENFTSHVVHQLRLSHEDLMAVNPRLITVSMPAYGSDGAWADLPALGTTVESMCGLQSLTGYEGGPPRIQGTSWDPVIGLHAAFAILAAMNRRRATGLGQHIEVSHIEAGTQLVAGPLLEYLLAGRVPPRRGNSDRTYAPHGCYPAEGDEQWVTIVARNDAEWAALGRVLDPEGALQRPEFLTVESRLEHRPELDDALLRLTSRHSKEHLFERLQAAGVPCGPVSSPADLLADPQLAARDFFVPMERAFVGMHLYTGSWIRMGRNSARFERPAPTLGQDNEAILAGRLGLSSAELAELAAAGIIGTRPVPAQADRQASGTETGRQS